jgi:hypothetical protein
MSNKERTAGPKKCQELITSANIGNIGILIIVFGVVYTLEA